MKLNSSMLIRILIILLCSGGAVISVLAGDDTPDKHSPTVSPVVSGAPGEEAKTEGSASAVAAPVRTGASCLSDPSVLEDLRKQRELLQVKQKELATREAELKAREQAITEELKKLEAARGDIIKVDNARKKENEERVTKLVETFETMKPAAAAVLLASLDDTLAVSAMGRISTPKLAKIMNVMEPKRSSRLTELLAGVVRARESAVKGRTATSSDVDAATALSPSSNGGEMKGVGKGGERM